jgi:hypothetical protein
MKDGFGLGVGSAIAQRVVSGIFGAPKIEMTSQPQQQQPTAYEQCMKQNSNDHNTCKGYLSQ